MIFNIILMPDQNDSASNSEHQRNRCENILNLQKTNLHDVSTSVVYIYKKKRTLKSSEDQLKGRRKLSKLNKFTIDFIMNLSIVTSVSCKSHSTLCLTDYD